MLRVKSLHIYPIKGIRAIDLQEAAVEKRGLSHDRRWMIVDAQGKFVTQRENTKLATLQAEITPEGLRLNGSVEAVASASTIPVKVWKSEVPAYAAAEKVSAWLSEYLGSPVTLVFQGDIPRATSQDWSNEGDEVSFADGFPLLITNEKSLDDLNQKLQKPLPMNRFRANIVIEGAHAWAEDTWKKIKIGDIEIDIVKPCARCIVTTTDQQTGLRENNEPLATLKNFRMLKQQGLTGVIFGQNAIPRKTGTVRLGDVVEILETQNPPGFANTL